MIPYTVKGTEFLRLFLMHVLPKGFVRIRHYGIAFLPK
ncbi:MAG: transposase [Roseburia sp.]